MTSGHTDFTKLAASDPNAIKRPMFEATVRAYAAGYHYERAADAVVRAQKRFALQVAGDNDALAAFDRGVADAAAGLPATHVGGPDAPPPPPPEPEEETLL